MHIPYASIVHIPNDNGYYESKQYGHNGQNNGHNPHFYWIDNILIPDYMRILQHIVKIRYIYDLGLAKGAGKHAEAMMKAGQIYHTPKEWMFGDAENVGCIDVRASDYERALWDIAQRFADDPQHGHNLLFPTTGVGIAVRRNERGVPTLFIAQRFVRKSVA